MRTAQTFARICLLTCMVNLYPPHPCSAQPSDSRQIKHYADCNPHQERVRQLQDSIYQVEVSEALGKYNAIYYNDILQKENERIEQRNHTFLAAAAVSFAMLLVITDFTVLYICRRRKRKAEVHKQNFISSRRVKYETPLVQYEEIDAFTSQEATSLTADDKAFLSQLASVIYAVTERGFMDINTITEQLGISISTLRRRLAHTLSVTPKTYILRMRMQKAKYLLQNYRDIAIADVADKCGYQQVQNFSRAFTRFYGMKPTEVKNERMKE